MFLPDQLAEPLRPVPPRNDDIRRRGFRMRIGVSAWAIRRGQNVGWAEPRRVPPLSAKFMVGSSPTRLGPTPTYPTSRSPMRSPPHLERTAYGCFVSDLTRFTGPHYGGSSSETGMKRTIIVDVWHAIVKRGQSGCTFLLYLVGFMDRISRPVLPARERRDPAIAGTPRYADTKEIGFRDLSSPADDREVNRYRCHAP